MIEHWRQWIIYSALVVFVVFLSWVYKHRCKHQWELVDKTVLPSRMKELCDAWGKPKRVSVPNALREACQVRVVLVIRCTCCGSAKVIRESN